VLAFLVLFLCGLGALKKLANLAPQAKVAFGLSEAADYQARFNAGDGMSVADAVRISEEIERRRRCSPQGEIFVWGTNGAVNFLTRTSQPTPYYYAATLRGLAQLPRASVHLHRFVTELETSPFEFAVLTSYHQNNRQHFPDAPYAAIDDVLSERFEVMARGNDWVAYQQTKTTCLSLRASDRAR
jgi:hypothetical protein